MNEKDIKNINDLLKFRKERIRLKNKILNGSIIKISAGVTTDENIPLISLGKKSPIREGLINVIIEDIKRLESEIHQIDPEFEF